MFFDINCKSFKRKYLASLGNMMRTWKEVQKFSWSCKETAPRDFKLCSINNVKGLFSIIVRTLKSCRGWKAWSPHGA